LRRYNQPALANQLRDRWLKLNERVYKRTGRMVEKYNVADMSLEAGGGEYPVQDGFGWTSGVALSLLEEAGARAAQ
jgi:alpha,alpha-trehalase